MAIPPVIVIVPGRINELDTDIVVAGLLPQLFVAVTLIADGLVKAELKVTFMLFEPWPLLSVTPAGNDQLYATPATCGTL